jgi:hypothetical protein
MAFFSDITGRWTDWLGPQVLPLVIAQFLPFFFVPPPLIAAACLWKWNRNAAKTCLKVAIVAFLIGIVWQMLIL